MKKEENLIIKKTVKRHKPSNESSGEANWQNMSTAVTLYTNLTILLICINFSVHIIWELREDKTAMRRDMETIITWHCANEIYNIWRFKVYYWTRQHMDSSKSLVNFKIQQLKPFKLKTEGEIFIKMKISVAIK